MNTQLYIIQPRGLYWQTICTAYNVLSMSTGCLPRKCEEIRQADHRAAYLSSKTLAPDAAIMPIFVKYRNS